MVSDYKDLVKASILEQEDFVRATFSGHLTGQLVPWIRVVIRPILLRNQRVLQFSYFDSRKDTSKNYSNAEAGEKLDELLALPFKNIHVATTSRIIQVNMTKKGSAIVHESKVSKEQKKPIELEHNREKDWILPANKPEPFLQAVGIVTREGKIKADMQSKFRQINEYLRLVDQTGVPRELDATPVHLVDCGCGNAYLTFATYYYFTKVLGLETKMAGIDVQSDLLEKHTAKAQSLGWSNLTFDATRIIDFKPTTAPHVVLALHACDTATDEAIAQGINWRSKLIVTAPCCHHELQKQLHNQSCPVPFGPVARHGILGERLGDILTDAFRALILRIMGYRTDVVQFVSAEHTAKNLMIRAVSGLRAGDPRSVQEYSQLKDYWHVTPYLEHLLGEAFTKYGAE